MNSKADPTFDNQKCAEPPNIFWVWPHSVIARKIAAHCFWFHGAGFYWQASGDPVGPYDSAAEARRGCASDL